MGARTADEEKRHETQWANQVRVGGYQPVTPLGPPPQGEPLFASGLVPPPPTSDGSRWYAGADVDLNRDYPDRYVLLTTDDTACGYVARTTDRGQWKGVRFDGDGRHFAGIYGNLSEAQLAVSESI